MQEQVQINIFVDRKPNNKGVIAYGRLVGKLYVTPDTTLQTLGASIYNFIEENKIVNYGSYKIIISGYQAPEETFDVNKVMHGYPKQDTVEMLLPNDIYVPQYTGLTVGILPNIIPRLRLNDLITVDIQPSFKEGLGKYVQ